MRNESYKELVREERRKDEESIYIPRLLNIVESGKRHFEVPSQCSINFLDERTRGEAVSNAGRKLMSFREQAALRIIKEYKSMLNEWENEGGSL